MQPNSRLPGGGTSAVAFAGGRAWYAWRRLTVGDRPAALGLACVPKPIPTRPGSLGGQQSRMIAFLGRRCNLRPPIGALSGSLRRKTKNRCGSVSAGRLLSRRCCTGRGEGEAAPNTRLARYVSRSGHNFFGASAALARHPIRRRCPVPGLTAAIQAPIPLSGRAAALRLIGVH